MAKPLYTLWLQREENGDLRHKTSLSFVLVPAKDKEGSNAERYNSFITAGLCSLVHIFGTSGQLWMLRKVQRVVTALKCHTHLSGD